MRTRRVIMPVVALAAAGALYVTNPSRDEYVQRAIGKARHGGGLHEPDDPTRNGPHICGRSDGMARLRAVFLFYTSMETGDTLVTPGICKRYALLRGDRAIR